MAIKRAIWLLALLGLAAAGCSEHPLDATNEDSSANGTANLSRSGGLGGPGAVYLMSNAAAGNEVLVYDRAPDGSLTEAGAVSTGGFGTGAGLGNQASMAFAFNGRRLYVVNAGSNDISTFEVRHGDLELIGSPVPSGGETPVSLAVNGGLLFALNAGGEGNISGFELGRDGVPAPIDGATRPLGAATAGPAQISFSPDGRVLVVSEKATNTLTTYTVRCDNGGHQNASFGGYGHGGGHHTRRVSVSDPQTFASAGQTPFGFGFDWRGTLIVSEAAGGMPGASTVSSYRVNRHGDVHLITGPVATTQGAACWIVLSPDNRYAFTTNTGSGTISSLDVGRGGTLSLKEAVAAETGDGSAPQDAAFSRNGRFLYVRNNSGNIGAFEYDRRGHLTHIGDFGTLPAGANGMLAQ